MIQCGYKINIKDTSFELFVIGTGGDNPQNDEPQYD